MPEYLAPGVVVEEVSFRAKSIEGVGTSVAGIVGPTRSGPLRGTPEVVTSFADFTRVYGDAEDLEFGGTEILNHTAIAAKAFFDNGGKQLFVARTVGGVNSADEDHSGSSASAANRSDNNGHVTFTSRFPGRMGNYWLELSWTDSENLLKLEAITTPAASEVAYLEATGVPVAAKVGGAVVSDDSFPLSIKAMVTLANDVYSIDSNRAEIKDKNGNDVAPADVGGLQAAQLPGNARLTRVRAKQPASGKLVDGTWAVLRFTEETDLSTFTGVAHWGGLTILHGTLNKEGTKFTVAEQFPVAGGGTLNTGVSSAVTFDLAALAADQAATVGLTVQRSFNIDVRAGDKDGEVIYAYGDISTDPDGGKSLPTRMPAAPARRFDQLTSPVACKLADSVFSSQIVTALYRLFDNTAVSPTRLSDEPRYLIELQGGADGNAPQATDYGGEADEVKGSTGFAALEDVEDISIVMTPAAAAHSQSHQAVVAELQKHCRKMRYRVGIVDAQKGMSLSEVREFASNFDDSRLALYYPWIVVSDPTGRRVDIAVPPGGFVAGVYANTDVTRGVHKPPANEPVVGALRFAQEINRFQQELLNPNGINCLRSFPGRGHRVWGGRTLSSDPAWKYVNVRRFFLYLERSIDKSTQWVVFEPNGERLWANVRSAVEDFLYNEWFNGRLLGTSPKEAYFVRCDRSTMTQNDLDNGRLVCLVGVAPLKPAEFVIFRIGQKTADSSA